MTRHGLIFSLIQRRYKLGLSQIGLAKKMGKRSQSYISELEDMDNSNPTLETLITWTTALDCYMLILENKHREG